ncbi:MAG TPA: NAD(P)-dependent oxidoreductase [Devosia sp.]|nr:NAD(P)-dependent oxidoreductase [Devosia sp.]
MIIVTGGSGKVGRAAVKHLMEKGYKVASVDLAKPPGMSNPPKPTDPVFTRIDITDFGQVMSAFSGIDNRVEEKVEGIVHLGAIASPGEAADEVEFTTNTISTYNVFEAARRLGIRNIVWASSETVYGVPYAKGPAYVPVDEDIELPQWSYALSKLMGEKLAEQFAKWDTRTKIIGLRFSNVQEPADYENFPGYDKDPHGRKFNLWTYIDARDAAQAIRLALESKLRGAHVYGIANTNSVMTTRDNDALLDAVFPKTKRKRPLKPFESLISIEKAQRELGYRPRFNWKPVVPEGAKPAAKSAAAKKT